MARYWRRGSLEVKQQMIDIRLKASEVRDTARSLHISPTTILSELKEKAVVPALVNIALLCTLNPEKVTVGLEYTGEAEMDEMWSFVDNQGNPRWLWHTIDHGTGVVLAYVFGRLQDAVFLKLQALLAPFGLTHYYTDHWGA
jgi:insertion element IS1 protein InsB